MNNKTVKNIEASILDFLKLIEKLERQVFCEVEFERELERFSNEIIDLALKKGYVKLDGGLICPGTFRLTAKGKRHLVKSKAREENQSRYHY